MTVPFRPDDTKDAVAFAAAARKQGFSADQIADALERNGHAQYAKELRGARENSVANAGASAADGVVWGVLNPIAAAAGTAVQKLSGDDRDMGTIYQQLKADGDNRSRAYSDANPGMALGTKVTGAFLSGKANPAALRVLGNATMGGRAVNSAVNAGAGSAAASLLNTEENLRSVQGWKNAGTDAAKAGGIGAAAGLFASPLLEGAAGLVRGGYRMLPQAFQDGAERAVDNTVGRGTRAVRGAAADAVEKLAPASPSAPSLPSSSSGAVVPSGAGAPPAPRSVRDVVRQEARAGVQAVAQGIRGTPKGEQPMEGVARIINRLQAQGMSIDELERLSQTADGPDIIAELIGEKGIRDLDAANLLGNKAPDMIRTTLDGRAADELPRWQAALERLSGVKMRDPQAFGREVVDNAMSTARPKYDATQPLPVPDASAAGITARLQELSDDGLNLWNKARLADASFPKEPTDQLTVGQLQRLRQVLDDQINYGANPLNQNSIERSAQARLKALRSEVDGIAKRAGGTAFEEADAEVAKAMRKAQAFELGATDGVRAKSPEELTTLAQQSGDPDAFREGIASARQMQVQGMRDGAAGGIQNPYAAAMGSPGARAVTRAGLPSDEAMTEAKFLAERGAKRMGTRNAVLGNSSTTRRGLDVMEQVGGAVNPMELAAAVANPTQAGARGLSALWTGARRRVLGDQMDEMAPLLLSGADGQMSRADAIAKLRELYPILEAKWAQDVLLRGRAGAAIGDRATRRQ